MNDAIETLFKHAEINGVSQSELSRRLGLHRSRMSNLKKADDMHLSLYLDIAEAIGCKVVLVNERAEIEEEL